ncbi:hypothetical protein [Tropicimonas sp. IMCC34043]|uniref:hypothetical protein n=1 Tax=Tropicimonas sp. IMCC34043 TaxID=2248760 RepID=UPI000E23BDC2|nr:hypothetical protein [Tropicimonas sp. IMCC34043]
MEAELKLQMRQVLLVGLLAFAAALAARLIGLDSRVVWLDEAYTQFAISRDWAGLVKERVDHGHTPTYFAFLKALRFDVHDLLELRLATAVLDALGCAILAAALAVHAGLRSALFFGLLYAFSPVMIQWGGQNARPYGLMMLFLSIGLAGAFGLFATAERPARHADLRRDRVLFAFGFGGAAATMTAGVFAFVAVALTPYALPALRRNRAFRQVWQRALIAPGLIAFLSYMLVSRRNVVGNIGDYWADRLRPFGLESLKELWLSLLQGSALQSLPYHRRLPDLWSSGIEVVLSVLLVFFIVHGARRPGLRHLCRPLVGLAAGYAGLLVVSSISTSVLIERYFLPAWQPALALAALGMADLSRQWRGAIAVAALAVFQVAAGLNQSLSPDAGSGDEVVVFAPIVSRSPVRAREVLAWEPWSTRLKVELVLAMLDTPHERTRPGVLDATPERLRRAIGSSKQVYAAMPAAEWHRTFAPAVPAPDCLIYQGVNLLALWGPDIWPECEDPADGDTAARPD